MTQVSTIICIGVLVPAAMFFGLKFFDCFSKNRWFCDHFGWHKTPNAISSDGCSNTGICPRCGKKVLQNSQGNWL